MKGAPKWLAAEGIGGFFLLWKKNLLIIPCSLMSSPHTCKLPFPSPFALKEFQTLMSVASAHVRESLSLPPPFLSWKREKSIRLTSHHKQLSPKGWCRRNFIPAAFHRARELIAHDMPKSWELSLKQRNKRTHPSGALESNWQRLR